MKKLLMVSLFAVLMTSAFAMNGYSESQADLKQFMNNGEKVLVIFGATWCGPCQRMKRDVWSTNDFQDFAENLGVEKFYFDTDQNGSLARKWGVSTIPSWFTVIGNDIKTKRGSASKSSVKNTMNSIFN